MSEKRELRAASESHKIPGSTMSLNTISFRPIRPQDEPILSRIYASTRQDEMALVNWSEQDKAAFLQMQFEAQHKFYLEQFKSAEFLLILKEGEAVGRLYVDRRPDEIRLIDIALLPEHRNTGLGSELLRDLLAEAESVGKPVRIHVEQQNPALRLYERLGFVRIDDHGVYYLMEWTPKNAARVEPHP